MTGNFWRFLLVSANLPDRQPLNQKKEVVVKDFKNERLKKKLTLDLIMAALLKDTRSKSSMFVKWWVQNFGLQILKSVTCLDIFNIKELYQG